MQTFARVMAVALVGWATAGVCQAFEMTAAVQAKVDAEIAAVKAWAAEPVIVDAVKAQNTSGPLKDMDNTKWKSVRRSDPIVKGFESNPAGQLLAAKLSAANGRYSEAFLSAAQGEKVAFVEKTSSYIHKGAPKFDVPFTTGKPWQGQPEFDESSQTHELQVSVPVVSGGATIGVLVVGINLTQLGAPAA